MLIDGFTVAAQVVNFLVLVVVLKLVLFDRVVAAMDRREAAIAERLTDAATREEDARAEAEAYRVERRALDDERQRRLDAADVAAAERRAELVAQARADVDELRRGWEDALRRDRAHVLEEVRRRTGEQVCAISRRALADLADAQLETLLVRVAVRRLDEDRQRLAPLVDELASGGGPVTIRTSAPLDDDLAARVTSLVCDRLDCAPPDVELGCDPELVCGLEIRVGGWSVGWNVDSYLDAVADELEALLPAGADGADANGADPDGAHPDRADTNGADSNNGADVAGAGVPPADGAPSPERGVHHGARAPGSGS
ncbi:MAG: hypothetical protein S0880_01830 [Actinomycetota bacterium]|nr:hypothetical protein [Actinomycetota bacterium]